MTSAELARVQGYQTGELAWKAAETPVSKRGHQISNAMAVPVVMEAMRAVLTAAQLI